MRYLGLFAFLAISTSADAQQRVSVREAAENSFIATLSGGQELEIGKAQQQILTAASEACKGLIPVFGNYTFGARKPVSAKSTTEATFEFHQAFTCEEQASVVPQAPPTVLSEEESSRLVEFALRETERSLADPDEATQRAFHSRFSTNLSSMLPLREWLGQQRSLHKEAGAIRGRPMLKTTIYTDPPNAPSPGTYVAVDFQATYQQAPFRCGYVMWLRNQAGEISVLRVEDGIINQKEAGAMTTDELAQTRQQLRCLSPLES